MDEGVARARGGEAEGVVDAASGDLVARQAGQDRQPGRVLVEAASTRSSKSRWRSKPPSIRGRAGIE
jgi:hypothetical protein